MYVHDVCSCDIVLWATNFLIVCHVTRDNVFIQNMMSDQLFFCNMHTPTVAYSQFFLHYILIHCYSR